MEGSAVPKMYTAVIIILSILIVFLLVYMIQSISQIAFNGDGLLPDTSIDAQFDTTKAKSDFVPGPEDTLNELPPILQDEDDESVITVEVLNGVGEKGLAQQVRNYLLENFAGQIDVYKYENALSFEYDLTLIVDRRQPFMDKKIDRLKRLTRIETTVNQRYETGVDASIILGDDWPAYFPEVARNRGGR